MVYLYDGLGDKGIYELVDARRDESFRLAQQEYDSYTIATHLVGCNG